MGVTTKDLARICKVSRATVTRALHGNGSIREETKKKILDTARELGYQPDLVARSLVKGKSYMIGVVVVDLKNQYFPKIVDAIGSYARQHGYMISISTHEDDKEEEKRLIQSMKGYHVDGLILNCINKDEAFEKMLLRLGIPYVVLGHGTFHSSHTVGIDEYQSAREAVRFLARRGYRKMVFVCPSLRDADGEPNTGHWQRYQGFLAEAEALGCRASAIEGRDYAQKALAMLRETRAEKPVFLCSGDMFAGELLRVLREAGFHAPGDYGVMGYDKIGFYQDQETPLSTVDNHGDLVGCRAAELVIDLIEGREAPQRVEIPFGIIEGKTV